MLNVFLLAGLDELPSSEAGEWKDHEEGDKKCHHHTDNHNAIDQIDEAKKLRQFYDSYKKRVTVSAATQ